MNRKISIIKITLFVILLFFVSGCDNKIEKAKEEAEAGLKKVEQRDKKAKEIIDEKLRIGAKLDNRFEGYIDSDKNKQSDENMSTAEGSLIGMVAVWGEKPGSVGSAEGFSVELINDEGDSYSESVDSDNRYIITAPPGNYILAVSEAGYENFEKKVTIVSGQKRLVSPIGLKNN